MKGISSRNTLLEIKEIKYQSISKQEAESFEMMVKHYHSNT